MERPAWVEIDTDALAYNMRNIRKKVGDREIMAVVKADAYGHGAVEAARIFLENGATRLAVSMMSEAVELREAGISCPILILGWSGTEAYAAALEWDVTLAIYSYEEAKLLDHAAETAGKKAKVHLKLDTGMSRIGLLANKEGEETAKRIMGLQHLDVEGIFSHFSKADEKDKGYARKQFAKFCAFTEDLAAQGYRFRIRHMANSAAIMELPDTYMEMVRPGIILYGMYPSDEVNREELKIRPAMRIKAKVSRVQWLEKGTLVGYGGTYETADRRKIVTVPVGYADGYHRLLSNRGMAEYKGQLLPIVGNVCMDQCMVDGTEVEIACGDEVVLLGGEREEISAEGMARMLGTISYEVLCDFALRLRSKYV